MPRWARQSQSQYMKSIVFEWSVACIMDSLSLSLSLSLSSHVQRKKCKSMRRIRKKFYADNGNSWVSQWIPWGLQYSTPIRPHILWLRCCCLSQVNPPIFTASINHNSRSVESALLRSSGRTHGRLIGMWDSFLGTTINHNEELIVCECDTAVCSSCQL